MAINTLFDKFVGEYSDGSKVTAQEMLGTICHNRMRDEGIAPPQNLWDAHTAVREVREAISTTNAYTDALDNLLEVLQKVERELAKSSNR